MSVRKVLLCWTELSLPELRKLISFLNLPHSKLDSGGFPRAPLSWKDRPHFITANFPRNQLQERGSRKKFENIVRLFPSHATSLFTSAPSITIEMLNTKWLWKSLDWLNLPALPSVNLLCLNLFYEHCLFVPAETAVSWWPFSSCGLWKWHFLSLQVPTFHSSYLTTYRSFLCPSLKPRPINSTTYTPNDFQVILPSFLNIWEPSSLFFSPPLLVLPSTVTLTWWALQHLVPHRPHLLASSCPFLQLTSSIHSCS